MGRIRSPGGGMQKGAMEHGGTSRVERAQERRVEGWVEPFARAGYAAKGVVYGMVGILALQAAVAGGGESSGTHGALAQIARQPFGTALLVLVLVGLVGYAAWRFVQSFKDVEGHGRDAEGLVKRAGYAVSGLVYLGLAAWGLNFLTGIALAGSGSGDDPSSEWTARLMDLPLGRWLVILAGLAVMGVGLYQFRRAARLSFMRKFRSNMDARSRGIARVAGRLGISARSVVFLMIGGFLIHAAWTFDPSDAVGLRGSLNTIARQPYGPWLLGVVAVGFVAYGVHCLMNARYRAIG